MNCECVICKNKLPFEMPPEIIEAVKNETLAFFCGAGISTEKKSVLPWSFYSSIKAKLSIVDDAISFSDVMQMYCDRPDGRRKLIKAIKERFEYIHSFPELERQATTFHKELAELYQIKTIITTNWDTYFETYCNATPITHPADFSLLEESSRYVLKLHGSIDSISSIIATTDDYARCTDSLQRGSIGSMLKSILARKTVVFAGYSFGDSDFNQILDFLHNEQQEFLPHIFIVSLDSEIKSKLPNLRATSIITDGTHFLYSLKQILAKEKLLVNLHSKENVSIALEKLSEVHSKTATISMYKQPCVLYSLAYQDGIIHSFERFFQLYSTGAYNSPIRMRASFAGYSEKIRDRMKSKNYWDVAYYKGYQNGLLYIAACDENPSIIEDFPMYYLPTIKYDILTIKALKEALREISPTSLYYKYAFKDASKYKEQDTVIHHPPF